MACTAPQRYYKADPVLNDGKGGLTKNAKKALLSPVGLPLFLTVKCGNCADCRLQQSYEWSLRIMHEIKTSEVDGSFVTLTYSDGDLPEDYGLDYRHFQLFMHRLRKRLPRAGRFFMAGEYGDQFGRPHYHAILFNCEFPDKKFWKYVDGVPYYTSELLSSLWGHGFTSIGAVTLQSAGYVARYSMKKVKGPEAGASYQWMNPETGEVFDRVPPFCHMSLKPGIGYDWFMLYHADVFPADYLVFDGRKFPVPRYYTKLFEQMHLPEASGRLMGAPKVQKVLDKRIHAAKVALTHPDNTPRRLRDRWEISQIAAKAKARKDL